MGKERSKWGKFEEIGKKNDRNPEEDREGGLEEMAHVPQECRRERRMIDRHDREEDREGERQGGEGMAPVPEIGSIFAILGQ